MKISISEILIVVFFVATMLLSGRLPHEWQFYALTAVVCGLVLASFAAGFNDYDDPL